MCSPLPPSAPPCPVAGTQPGTVGTFGRVGVVNAQSRTKGCIYAVIHSSGPEPSATLILPLVGGERSVRKPSRPRVQPSQPRLPPPQRPVRSPYQRRLQGRDEGSELQIEHELETLVSSSSVPCRPLRHRRGSPLPASGAASRTRAGGSTPPPSTRPPNPFPRSPPPPSASASSTPAALLSSPP